MKEINKNIPRTWDEYRKNTMVKSIPKNILTISTLGLVSNKVILDSDELSDAVVALCKLFKLRDCYNEGWQPDWTDNENKYCIELYKGVIIESVNICTQHVLSFRTEEVRSIFFENFKDIIEIAKPLL